MPIQFTDIDLTGDTTHARQLFNVVEALRKASEQIDFVQSRMENMQDGVDYSGIESRYNLPTGAGDEVYNAIVSAKASLDSAAIQAIITRLG